MQRPGVIDDAARVHRRYDLTLFSAPLLVLTLILIVGQLLSGRYRALPAPALTVVAVLAISLEAFTYYEERRGRFSRAMLATTTLVACITAVEIEGVVYLLFLLVRGGADIHGAKLLISGLYYWSCNILAFGLWFWLLDRGGPPKRAARATAPADFLFPEMTADELRAPDWAPGFVEYMYLAFTNATAFSPTDTLPLSTRARFLMASESIISLVVIAVVMARAINILK